MKKVCLFHLPKMDNFHGYSIDSLDPLPYFPSGRSSWGRALVRRRLTNSAAIDEMYRTKDASYMRFVRDFIDKFSDADLIILSTYNPIHPNVLDQHFKKPIKVLGFIDDPVCAYTAGIAYLWAFDAAFYISPSYNDHLLYKDALRSWGCPQSYWWPLVPPSGKGAEGNFFWPLVSPRAIAAERGDSFFRDRDRDLIYVGGAYDSKLDRLIELRQKLGKRLEIYGRWRLSGYWGAVRGLVGKRALWSRVRTISDDQRAEFYYRTKIGIDLHWSERLETGNMRMYEVPAHGMMLLCNKAGMNAHEQIFVPDKEAVFYDSVQDAVDKAKYYLAHDEEREKIARAGFERVHRDYDGEMGLKKFLDWASTLPIKESAPGNTGSADLRGSFPTATRVQQV